MSEPERLILDVVATEMRILSLDAFATVPVVSESPLQRDVRKILSLLPPGTIDPDMDLPAEGGVVFTWQGVRGDARMDVVADGSGLISFLVSTQGEAIELHTVSLGETAAVVERMAHPLCISLLLGVPIRRPVPGRPPSVSARLQGTCRTGRE